MCFEPCTLNHVLSPALAVPPRTALSISISLYTAGSGSLLQVLAPRGLVAVGFPRRSLTGGFKYATAFSSRNMPPLWGYNFDDVSTLIRTENFTFFISLFTIPTSIPFKYLKSSNSISLQRTSNKLFYVSRSAKTSS